MVKQIPLYPVQNMQTSQCALCKGSKMLCGKQRCPLLVRYHYYSKTIPFLKLNMVGDSPPGVFVGRIGYPYVFIGPLVPPFCGDTAILDTPEHWTNMSIDEIVNFRTNLIRGKYLVKVSNIEKCDKIVNHTIELALAITPTNVEVEFLKRPSGRLILDDEVQPFGPSAPIARVNTENIKFDWKIEKRYYDTDLKAVDAVLYLYNENVLISRIQKAFSVGAFGIKKRRRFVPTRWSITAVDSIISINLVDKLKEYPLINEYRVYERVQLDNRWIILLLPISWCYELIEAWYPETIWNPSNRIVMFSDHENHKGRTTYAQIGGCYYAARLAVSEFLVRERRQSGVVIMREIHPGYIMPVGVWNVRENVRNALKTQPLRFNTLNDALQHIRSKLDISISRWIYNSTILKNILHQKRIDEFFE